MSTESYLWKKLKLLPKSKMTRHEDKFNLGIPDVSFSIPKINGWIELKAFTRWAVRDGNKFHNLQSTQVKFLRKRGKLGGNCWLMLIVNRQKDSEFLLFHWSMVRDLYKTTLSKEDLINLSSFHCEYPLDYKSLFKVLKEG